MASVHMEKVQKQQHLEGINLDYHFLHSTLEHRFKYASVHAHGMQERVM